MRRTLAILKEHPLIPVVAIAIALYALLGDRLPSINLEQILENLAESLGAWTYLLVSALAFLETGAFVGLVFPGETAVIVAGAIAGQGETSIVLTIALVWFSAWAGDTVSFLLGRRLGRDFILRHGSRFKITPERFARVEDYFDRHGGKTILVGRFIGLIRALAPFIAGSSGMRYGAFLPYSVLGTGLWAVAFSLLGYFLAESLDRAGAIAGTGALIFGTLVGIVVGTVLTVQFLRVPANRAKVVAWMEARTLLRPLVALGRRFRPQARFVWRRLTPGELGLELTSLVAVLAVGAFIVIGYGSVVSGDPGPTPGDTAAFDMADRLASGWMTDLAEVITFLGSGWVTFPVALIAVVALLAARRTAEALVIIFAVAITHVGVAEIKDLVERPRPPDPLIDARGWSYPSGHTANAIIYPWIALTMTLRLRPGRLRSGLLIGAAVALAAAIGLSRVYLRVHYLSDVSGGAAFGVSLFALCAAVALVITYVRSGKPADAEAEDDPGDGQGVRNNEAPE